MQRHAQFDARDEGRLVGGEVKRGIGHIPGGSLPAHRHQRGALPVKRLGRCFRVDEMPHMGRVDDARQDDIGADAMGRIFPRHRPREPAKRGLRRLVRRIAVGPRHHRDERGDIAIGTRPLCPHRRQGGPRQPHRRHQIDVEHPLPIRIGAVDEPAQAADPDIVVEDVEPAPRGLGRGLQRPPGIGN
jgi:hypothetical protein